MSWLDNFYRRGEQAKRSGPPRLPEPRAAAPRSPRPIPKLEHVWITTRPASADDPGGAEIGWFTVEDGVVVMRDEDGKATGAKQALRTGDDPRAGLV